MKTGLILIIGGVLLFIFSTVAPFFIIIPLFFMGSGEQFSAPGSKDFELTTKGEYYLWNDYETTFEDKKYLLPEDLPDNVKYELKDESGKVIQNFNSSTSQSQDVFGTARRSIGYYSLDPGKYTLTISGLKEKRIFSFGINKVEHLGPYIGIGILAALLTTPISFIIVWIGIILLIRAGIQKSRISRLEAEYKKESAN